MDFVSRFLGEGNPKVFSRTLDDYQEFSGQEGYDYRSWITIEGEKTSNFSVRDIVADGLKESHYKSLEKKVRDKSDCFDTFQGFDGSIFVRKIDSGAYSVIADVENDESSEEIIYMKTRRDGIEEVTL